ncbi:MAG: extracellular solute-binding protein, partial [Anaerolineaceae bacterium]
DELYGLPLSVETSALYYNKALTDGPPETLTELLEHAVEGKKVAINTNFDTAFWGIQAFGGRLLDEEGRVVLNQGGFANWLDWLIEAGNVPNIILSKDEAILNDLFAQGEVAYYVGQSSELLGLQDILGAEVVGVSPLPVGPNNSAGPFLTTEPIFFSMDSSPAQTERAMLLIEFLGNVEQQRRLALQTGRVPVNPQARINRRISPAVAGFVEQSKTANPLFLLPQIFDVIELGEEIYLQALEGLVTSSDAASELTKAVNDTYGLETVEVTPADLCNSIGDIEVWHAWSEPEAIALEQIGRQFSEYCPRVFITFTAVKRTDLFRRYRQAVQDGQGPDLLLISSEYSTRLASAELVGNISDQIEPDFLQRYIPNVPEAMRFEGGLYGLPVSVDTMALYYNDLLVKDPPVDLGDLMTQISPDQQFALPYTPFRDAHWGLTAFGGRLFDIDGSLDVTSGGFGEWLNWLQKARNQPGLMLTRNQAEAQELFSQGKAAYFVGERRQLNELQEQLGENLVRVAPLPAGPEGSSGPILDVQGFMVNPNSSEAMAAIEFAKYAASAESQALLMREGNLAPAHVNVAGLAAFPAISGFLDQAKTAVVIANRAETDTIFGLGDIIYESVLEDGADPAAVLEGFTTFFEQVHGAGEEGALQSCDWEGQLILWHSVEGVEASVLDQNIANFGRHCPKVQVEALFVPAEDLPGQLAVASSAGAPPDLFLAPHDLIEPLSAERLIKPITPWVTESTLIPYLKEATDAMRHSGVLYGLPQSLDTTVLYYNTDLVSEPEQQLFDLVASTTISAPLALDTSFDDAFWGAVVFGGELFSLGEGAQKETLDIRRTSLVNWLGWLKSNKDRAGVVMNHDPEKLIEMFSVGNAAYLITGSDALPQLRAELDSDEGIPTKIGVARLPTGRAGQVSPLLTATGYLFSAAADEEQTQMALEFARVATSGEGQGLLMQSASRAPANVLALTLVDDSALNAIVDQARTSVLMPSRPENLVLKEGGEILFRSVLEDERSPSEAMAEFHTFLSETPQPVIVAYAGERVLVCEGDGRLLLWHSWPFAAETVEPKGIDDEQQTSPTNALERIIFEFNEFCPDVAVDTELVPVEDLPDRLAIAAAEGVAPDLFLAPHELIEPLANSESIKPITSLVDQVFLDQYLDKSVEALQYGGDLYGVPQTLDVAALYYNTGVVSSTVSTLDQLVETANPDVQIAIDTSFHNAHWGIGAFRGSLFDAEGKPLSDQSGFVDWLAWLQDAQERPGMVLDSDQDDLQQPLC